MVIQFVHDIHNRSGAVSHDADSRSRGHPPPLALSASRCRTTRLLRSSGVGAINIRIQTGADVIAMRTTGPRGRTGSMETRRDSLSLIGRAVAGLVVVWTVGATVTIAQAPLR